MENEKLIMKALMLLLDFVQLDEYKRNGPYKKWEEINDVKEDISTALG